MNPDAPRHHLSYARQLDAQDPLRSYRKRFHLPLQDSGHAYHYFCGNSLGCQPVSTRSYLETELRDWEALAVEGHFRAKNPWMPYHEFVALPMAKVVGGQVDEVIVMNTLTVNLHLMMVSFYTPTTSRFKILVEADAFPSDLYAVASQASFHGFDPEQAILKVSPREGEHCIRSEDLLHIIEEEGESIALILLGGVNYYTGQLFDMPAITQAGHAQGCLVGFDLAHAAGNVPLQLHDWDVDFACWCTYKYLNSGPGGIAGCFIHERHISRTDLPRFAGWWGHDKASRFQMGPDFRPIPTAEGWQLSNAPIFPMASLRASLEIFEEVGMLALQEKSRALTAYLEFLLKEFTFPFSFDIITPSDPNQRGCQLSLLTDEGGKAAFDRLEQSGVICDWREPNVIRLAPVPLYNSFEDVWQFAHILTMKDLPNSK
ncbi:MAG: kynureninase [Bacteroidota bacterium]